MLVKKIKLFKLENGKIFKSIFCPVVDSAILIFDKIALT